MMNDIYERLKAPFPPDAVSWRVGSTNKEKTKGMALAYIDARDVMNRLDEVCGPAGWQCEYVPMPNGTACCRIGIYAGADMWIWKANGAENLTDSDKADAKEMAIKGTYSDAFKRAAVLWGIGRYLYDLPSPWVALNQYKQIETQEFDKLRRLLAPAKAAPSMITPALAVASRPPAPPAKAAPKPNDKAIAAHRDVFRFALQRADSRDDVAELWNDDAEQRAKLGIAKGSEAYETLAGMCRDRLEEIGLSMANAEAAGVP